MPSNKGTVYINHKKTKDKKVERSSFVKNSPKNLGINTLVQRANLIIFETASRSRFLRPSENKITICPNRVTITYSSYLYKDEYPMPIENITGARVFCDMRYGTLHIDTFGIVKPEPLKYLQINDARLARRYILALMECKKANIELPYDDVHALREKLKSIGMVRYSTQDKDYHQI